MCCPQKSSRLRNLLSAGSFYRHLACLMRYKGSFYMTLASRIAPHLPYLRRFSRATTGSQTSGDAYVAATLEALIADTSIFPERVNDRVGLYKLFSTLFSSSAVRVPEPTSSFAWELRAGRREARGVRHRKDRADPVCW